MGALFAAVKGEVEVADLLSPPPVPAGRIAKIRFVHHQLAQLIARGLHYSEVSRITGTCQNRISILMADPTFNELVAFYGKEVAAANVKTVERLGQLTLMASEELQSRLEERPEEVSTKDLVKIMSVSADRSGNGPTTKVLNGHLHMTQADLLELKGGKGETVLLTTTDRGAARSSLDNLPVGDSEAPEGAEEKEVGQDGTGLRDEGLPGDQAALPRADIRETVDTVFGP